MNQKHCRLLQLGTDDFVALIFSWQNVQISRYDHFAMITDKFVLRNWMTYIDFAETIQITDKNESFSDASGLTFTVSIYGRYLNLLIG